MSSTGTDGDGNTRHDDDDQRRLTFPLVRADASREIVRSHAFAFRKPGWPDHEPDMKRTLDVVYQDADLMVVHKPPNLLIDADEWSVQEYLQRTYPEVPLFHLIHQIDYATSGIMVLGLEKKSTGRVAKLFQQRLVRKEYVAVVRGWIAQDVTTVSCHIGNDPSVPIRMAVTAEADGKLAETVVHVRRRGYLRAPASAALLPSTATEGRIPVTLVHLNLLTGRRHQLRVHLASLGHPIVGDPLYEASPPAGVDVAVATGRAAWPWKSLDDPAAAQQARMLLHAHYILLPLHRGRTKTAGRYFSYDLSVRIPAPFVGWVACQACLDRSKVGGKDDDQCAHDSDPAVATANMDRWETDREVEARQDYAAEAREKARQAIENKERRERKEKRRAEVLARLETDRAAAADPLNE